MADQVFAFPASFAQQRLWFINCLMPGNPAYNIHTTVPLGSLIDPDKMRESVSEIVRRHETLRTTFELKDGQLKQLVHPATPFSVPVIDLQADTNALEEQEALEFAQKEAQYSFDLETGPLLRVTLLRRRNRDLILLVTMHHIISDGWSLGIFFKELAELYTAHTQNRAPQLGELPIQYADFSVWQRDWLTGEVLDEQLSFWKERLKDLSTLQLPTDRRRPAAATFVGAEHELRIPARLTNELKNLARREGATLFMLLLTAFKILLQRYSRQNDIVVGSPIANRNIADIEGLIGFFVNTLVLRTDLSGDPTFLEALTRVREVSLAAYSHQDLPFEMLVEALQPDRDLSRNPLFQVVFQLHNTPATTALAQASEEETPLLVHRATSNFDLTFDMWEANNCLRGRLNYATDLFNANTVARMAGLYRRLLEGIVSNPQQRISELPLLLEDEQRKIVHDWNQTSTDYPRDIGIHELFEEWAQTTPERVAICFKDQKISYRDLNQRADRIARLLKTRIRTESVVGVYCERSTEAVVAMLAILKAGSAYLTIDPSLPPQRVEFMVKDAAIEVILTTNEFKSSLDDFGVKVFALDADDLPDDQSEVDSEPEVNGGNLAYICYTSGSTGTPKGVMVCHRSVARLVKSTNYARLDQNEVFLQFSALSFDASTFEIWGSLCNGAQLVIQDPGAASLLELGQTIERQDVTTLWLTSGLFNQIVDHQAESLDSVRQLLSGGDVLSPAHVKKALLAPGRRELINGYGPTEATTFTCCHRMTDVASLGDTIPIGRPIANTTVFVLDRNLNPVPPGIPGELYIGGDGLARGYMNQPELTAEKFVPHHLTDKPGQRIYRTGDLVRYREDGVIEFIGRLDRQAKLRGFRVEPGEVEAVLLDHPALLRAHVSTINTTGDKRLAAFFVAQTEIASAEVRTFLEQRLPAFMLPAFYTQVAEIPLTENGKVDETKLITSHDTFELDQFTPPSGELEEALAGIWSEVLNVNTISAHHNFFTDLGGHSLLATQVISRVRQVFTVDLPLRRFFELPTIAALAGAIESELIAEIELMSDQQAAELLNTQHVVSLENEHVG